MPKTFALSDLLGTTPAPIQRDLLTSTEFEVGMITGFAAGKTRGICAAALAHGTKYPNAKVLLGRKTYAEMVNTVKQPFYVMGQPLADAGWFTKPQRWDYREGTHHARLRNGSQFFFSNFDDPVKFRNEEYSMIIADQAEELDEELWEILIARIRWDKVPPAAWQAIAAANDDGHNWVWSRFVDKPTKLAEAGDGCTLHPYCVFRSGHPDEDDLPQAIPCSTRRFFHGTTLDNRHNLSPRYLSVLLSHPEAWKRHFIYATMEGGSGRLLPDLRVLPHFDPPAHWPRYRAIDHALNSACCCVWITVNVDSAERFGVAPNVPYVYKEYWAENSSVDQHARRILAASAGEKIDITVIDKSVYHLTQSRDNGGRVSIADLYAEEGLYTVPSVGDPFARVERINGAHNRGMVVSDRCKHVIETAPRYYAEQSKSDGTYKILNKSSFHAIDALGYGLMVIPVDSREPLADPAGVLPDYLQPGAQLDEASYRHNRAEWKRLQRLAEKQEPAVVGATANIQAAEFWGDTGTLDEGNEVRAFDPWGRSV